MLKESLFQLRNAKSLEKFKEVFGNKVDNQMIIHPKIFSIDENITKIPPYMVWIAL